MKKILLLIMFLSNSWLFAQQGSDVIVELEELFKKESFVEADELVKSRINHFIQNKDLDTLRYYVGYLGRVTQQLEGGEAANKVLLKFLERLKVVAPNDKARLQISLKAAYFISTNGDHNLAYQIAEEVKKSFISTESVMQSEIPRVYFALGDFCIRQGNPTKASMHYREALLALSLMKDPEKELLFIANNSMGIVYHFKPDPDSAVYYWSKALDLIPALEQNALNKFSRRANVQNNLGNAYSSMGKQQAALKMYDEAFANAKAFLADPEPHSQKKQSAIYQLYTVDNMAKIYLDLGDLTKAYDLYEYAYQQKRKIFADGNVEIDKALLFLATVRNNQRKYKEVLSYCFDVLARLRLSGDTVNTWDALANRQLAIAYSGLKKPTLAMRHYEEADRIHRKILNGSFDQYYLYFTDGLTEFYTDNAYFDKAIYTAQQGIDHLSKSKQEHTTYMLSRLNLLGQAQYGAKQYQAVLTSTSKGLLLADKLLSEHVDILDSISVEIQKIKLLLYQGKATYQQTAVKDSLSIASLLKGLNEAMTIVKHRKGILADQNDVNLLLANYSELIDFIKQLHNELLFLSKDDKYLDKIISIHENSIYTRIRTRLDRQNAIHFARLPVEVQQEEIRLKEGMQDILKSEGAIDDKITAYRNASGRWATFQELLRKEYPDYYKMRYADSDLVLKEWRRKIPPDITVVRYLFSGDSLFALVISKGKHTYVPIDSKGLSERIISLNSNVAKTTALAFELYKQLWRPLAKEIVGARVVIIPDGILYNLSFEMLTPQASSTFSELSARCLLHQYAFSYHYSLHALWQDDQPSGMKGDFVAFAPGFSDQAKQQYLTAMQQDSIHLDQTYLALLPLPFTDRLLARISSKFGGRVFSHQQSTPSLFRQVSGYHQIIHIGTHAEANNDYPEYSRLIFAKDMDDPKAQNSLYLSDIYGLDLSSSLAVLMACESGKPGYQDGEGMISMAHAFSYAGSRSIMTGLWKLDEQATAKLAEFFYNNLEHGMPKDIALQKAKLKYLEQEAGRKLSPVYWAGLMIMGDLDPVHLDGGLSLWYYLLSAAVLILLFLFWRQLKKRM